MNKNGSYRTRDQLTSKWSHINCKVRKFIKVYEECAWSRRSGTNDTNVLRLATTQYQDDGHQGKVPIDLWRILSRSPKWQQLNNPDGEPSKKRSSVNTEVVVDDTINSSEQMLLFNIVNIDLWRILSRSPKWQQLNNPDGEPSKKRSSVNAEVVVDDTINSSEQMLLFNIVNSNDKDPIPRPIERKKAKFIVSGSGGFGDVSISSRNDISRAMSEQLQAFNIREKERMKRKEQEDEIKIRETNLSTLSSFKRMIYEQRQKEIKAKYNLP
ncbi:unnamed protein product [Cuscuta campestris]|uniref:No apical meristem-associated C-terminal domain-containing protein n=1 Tax=Cuscuta campestris TaxID=132261 RepID=A0A484KLG7_9ASTE|nr:unnamed protein product [Cuscuta campestris]